MEFTPCSEMKCPKSSFFPNCLVSESQETILNEQYFVQYTVISLSSLIACSVVRFKFLSGAVEMFLSKDCSTPLAKIGPYAYA